MPLGIDKIAVQVSNQPATDDVELKAIDRQQSRFSWLSIGTIVVSFAHMVGALALFSDGSWAGVAVAALMTFLVDFVTWVITGYYDYAKRRNLKRGWKVAALLWVALTISFGLNLVYLSTHMPSTIHPFIGWAIALAFAVFIPLCIAVASSARGELEDDKTLYLQRSPVNVDTVPRVKTVKTPSPPSPTVAALPATPAPTLSTVRYDERAADWQRLHETGMSFQAISDTLGGQPSRQYINKHVNLYLTTLTPSVDTVDATIDEVR